MRDTATSIEVIPGGVKLAFGPDQPVGWIAELMSLESECCPFYSFDLRIDGPTRYLEVSAGAGGDPAVTALLGLDEEGSPSFSKGA